MGRDSGLPDFRGDQGFWRAYPPLAQLGLSFVELAQPRWFLSDPELAWGFYGHRLSLYRSTIPHIGFSLLRRWAKGKEHGAYVLTSNVDGQFQKAGFSGRCVMECHGSIHYLQCNRPCSHAIWGAQNIEVQVDKATIRARPPLPRCEYCREIARPNILLFGDGQWVSHRMEQQEQRFSQWLSGLSGARLVIIECGAGTAVPTIREYAAVIAKRFKADLIRINPEERGETPRVLTLPLGAADAFQGIANYRG